MISILLLPFMCLSMAQEVAKAEGKPFSVNEITSSANYQAKRDERSISLASSAVIHNEGGGVHKTYGTAIVKGRSKRTQALMTSNFHSITEID